MLPFNRPAAPSAINTSTTSGFFLNAAKCRGYCHRLLSKHDVNVAIPCRPAHDSIAKISAAIQVHFFVCHQERDNFNMSVIRSIDDGTVAVSSTVSIHLLSAHSPSHCSGSPARDKK